jgi:uncharacterized protein with HEPN domain
MLQAIGKIQNWMQPYPDEFMFYHADEQLPYNAALMQLQVIGELTVKLSDELKSKHGYIPWPSIRNVRNRISHDYLGINRLVVWEILQTELPKLKTDLEQVIRHELADGNFDREELSTAIGNDYYRFIDFDALR